MKEKIASTVGASITSAPLFSVPISSKTLALTFDMDSAAENTSTLLDLLDSHQVKATFFITGTWLSTNEEILPQMIDAGHELGNHTDTHPDMASLKEKEQTTQLLSLHNKVLNLTGISMTLFRPPFGSYDYSVIQTARKNDYLTIHWSIDSNDWKDYGVNDIISHITDNKNLKNGAILRFHSSGAYTSQALEKLIPYLQEQGYHFTTVSELIALQKEIS